MRVIATTRNAAKGRRLTELGAAGIVLEGDGFAERARGALPERGADGAVDLIGGPAVLETLQLLRPGATACNAGSGGTHWWLKQTDSVGSAAQSAATLHSTQVPAASPSPHVRRPNS